LQIMLLSDDFRDLLKVRFKAGFH